MWVILLNALIEGGVNYKISSREVSIGGSILQTILSHFLIYLLFRSSKKNLLRPNYFFMFSAGRPGGAVRATGRQLTIASIAARAAAAALCCRYGLTLSAPVRCGAVGGGGMGGGPQGVYASYYHAEAENVCFPYLIHSYDYTIGP